MFVDLDADCGELIMEGGQAIRLMSSEVTDATQV